MSDNDALTLLENWVEAERGRAVEIEIDTAYGAHAWEIFLKNVDVTPEEDWYKCKNANDGDIACVYASETYFITGEIPPNMVYAKDPEAYGSSFPGLDATIRLAIRKAEELGI